MSGNSIIVGESLYVRALRAELEAIRGEGIAQFTAAYLAARISRKVTQHMKRALDQFERDGFIHSYRFFTDKGGLAKAYYFLQGQQLPLDAEKPF